MSYKLLKSLYVKVDEKDYKFDFTRVDCILFIDKYDNNSRYKITVRINYLPDSPKEKGEMTLYRVESDWVTDIGFILNNSLKCTIKENGYDSFKAFDNVIVYDRGIYIFLINDFNLKLSRELYSVPANELDDRRGFHCYGVRDLGVVRTNFNSLSVTEIALTLLKGKDIVFVDDGLYKIAITDRGKSLITRYKMAKGL